ncbi:hypothetical protein [Aminobacter sp. SS-2016]|uniref:hypothetical protein n=1 Tax=Aminobacter sp. Y103A TaxID=1870862 RepID=UPI0025722BB9|nr:hypothetical protein [Aminobacter sp. SS-2016]
MLPDGSDVCPIVTMSFPFAALMRCCSKANTDAGLTQPTSYPQTKDPDLRRSQFVPALADFALCCAMVTIAASSDHPVAADFRLSKLKSQS